ncbi:LysR family transcriptional regulator [Aureimonas leprariae]|uniref:LysR family transcriptional regulator n=1 Tax=Plantimonas leprariae TaxID=2615207 RepID=A0A7V7PNI0_9HYPH|nr:LysR family transcriptional regulator [Aureimonas leprariae]KAB0679334.1 LysR family transcriptional regulator [Aureimonas leprariae]
MRQADYGEFRAFAAVARHGGFTRAAAHLGVSVSTLSQTIRKLEERLGTRLLNRTTRSVSPTEAGARLAERLLPALDELDAAAAGFGLAEGAPSGRLRLNANRFAAVHIVAPLAASFLRRHPAVSFELVVDDALVDIVSGGFDAGVRLGERLENDMVAVRLGGPVRMIVVASPGYLAARGVPAVPDDLAGHHCINMRRPTDRSPYRWEFERDGEEIHAAVEGSFVCDDPAVRLRAAVDGLGLACVFEAEAAAHLRSGELVRVLDDWTPPFPGCFLYYPGRRHVGPALRAFIDHAKAELRHEA